MSRVALVTVVVAMLTGCGNGDAVSHSLSDPALQAGNPPTTGPHVNPRLVEEITVDGMAPRACGGVAPIDVLAAEPGAEDADTAEAAGLRDAFRDDPTGGTSPQRPLGWVRMSEYDD